MFPFISSKKAAATQKMTATYGAPGTINEYLTLPSSSSPRPKSELAVIQRVYAKELRHDKQIAATIRKHIVTHWWKPFCESADTEQMREVLGFEPCEFDEESVLDIGKVGYGKLVHSLVCLSLSFVEDMLGESTKLTWGLGDSVHAHRAPVFRHRCFIAWLDRPLGSRQR
jgi:hypothetical protein